MLSIESGKSLSHNSKKDRAISTSGDLSIAQAILFRFISIYGTFNKTLEVTYANSWY